MLCKAHRNLLGVWYILLHGCTVYIPLSVQLLFFMSESFSVRYYTIPFICLPSVFRYTCSSLGWGGTPMAWYTFKWCDCICIYTCTCTVINPRRACARVTVLVLCVCVCVCVCVCQFVLSILPSREFRRPPSGISGYSAENTAKLKGD